MAEQRFSQLEVGAFASGLEALHHPASFQRLQIPIGRAAGEIGGH